jgi:hypothetical protein
VSNLAKRMAVTVQVRIPIAASVKSVPTMPPAEYAWPSGAREAGAIYFIDYVLSQTEPDLQPIFRTGLKELAAVCAPEKFSE